MTHNSRGDIIGIYNGDGILKAQYKYDAWGNVLSVTDENGNAITSTTHVGNLNPFRYRGYYYDTESGFYYLMSRYYDPVTHRFINADGYFQSSGNILDANMSAYCANNPIVFFDPTGEFAISAGIATILIKAAITMVFVTAIVTVITHTLNKPSVRQAISNVADSVSGAISGAFDSSGGSTSNYANNNYTQSKDNSYSQSKDIAVPIEPPIKYQAIYPNNPMQFNPKGLVMNIYKPIGTGKNGGIIKWEIPGTHTAIFEWNEDYDNGSHYHEMLPSYNNHHMGKHRLPGETVNEPWNTMYFN